MAVPGNIDAFVTSARARSGVMPHAFDVERRYRAVKCQRAGVQVEVDDRTR